MSLGPGESKNSPPPRLESFHHEGHADASRLAEMKDTLKPLLKRLRPHIEKGEYSVLISDETSGRLPTLVVRNFVNDIYKQKGFPPVATLFYLGIGDETERNKADQQKFSQTIARIREENQDKKALIVTEQIRGGWRVGSISTQLTDLGVAHDIATLTLHTNHAEINYNRKNSGYKPIAPQGEIIYGIMEPSGGISIGPVEMDELKGVRHDLEIMQVDNKPQPVHKISVVREPEARRRVVEARKNIREISRELLEETQRPFFKKVAKAFGKLVGR